MFPGVYGFQWDPATLIFLGLFFLVVLSVLTTITISITRSLRDFRLQQFDAIRWHAHFAELPSYRKTCRHVFTGELTKRECTNAFDCHMCVVHAKFEELNKSGTIRIRNESPPHSFAVQADRFYHRGHTWLKAESDGTMSIGLDDFAKKLLGTSAHLQLPKPGTKVAVNGTAFELKKGNATVRILSPVEGEVIATSIGTDEWFLRVKPTTGSLSLRRLLRWDEAAAWLTQEFELAQRLVADRDIGFTLADGGAPIDDLSKAYPEKDWARVYSEIFLEP